MVALVAVEVSHSPMASSRTDSVADVVVARLFLPASTQFLLRPAWMLEVVVEVVAEEDRREEEEGLQEDLEAVFHLQLRLRSNLATRSSGFSAIFGGFYDLRICSDDRPDGFMNHTKRLESI